MFLTPLARKGDAWAAKRGPSRELCMAEERGDYGREVRDTVVKSGLTGVAATVLAVTVFSPAGLGGMVGTSVASGLGLDTDRERTAEDPFANLPAYPAPLTSEELDDIRSQLARTAASLEITRAATEAKIERVRSIAEADGLVTFTRAPQASVQEASLAVQPASVAAPAPVVTAANQAVGGSADSSLYQDQNLELAELLLAHELF